MQNTQVRFGPLALTNAVANIINPATLTGGVNPGATKTYILIKHIRVVNKTAGAITCSFYIGATGASAAGTEYLGNGLSVPANSYIDFYGNTRLDSTDFLTGVAGANTSLTFEAEGEIGIVV